MTAFRGIVHAACRWKIRVSMRKSHYVTKWRKPADDSLKIDTHRSIQFNVRKRPNYCDFKQILQILRVKAVLGVKNCRENVHCQFSDMTRESVCVLIRECSKDRSSEKGKRKSQLEARRRKGLYYVKFFSDFLEHAYRKVQIFFG